MQSKIIILFLTVILLHCSCAKTDLPPTSATNSTETIAFDSQQSVANNQENGNISNAIFSPTPPIVSDEKIKLPYQKKARRKFINFPDDCHYFPNQSDANWQLQLACAESLDNVLPSLPDEGCEYGTFQKNNSEKPGSSWFDGYDIDFYPLSINKYLIKVRCIVGAYNKQNTYLLYDESALPAKARVLEFPSFEFTHDEDSDIAKTIEKVTVKIVGGRFFDPKTKQLIVFVKARGIGDAGEYARYSFPNDKPKLEEFRAKFKWDGHGYQGGDVIKSPPKTWRRYYP